MAFIEWSELPLRVRTRWRTGDKIYDLKLYNESGLEISFVVDSDEKSWTWIDLYADSDNSPNRKCLILIHDIIYVVSLMLRGGVGYNEV